MDQMFLANHYLMAIVGYKQQVVLQKKVASMVLEIGRQLDTLLVKIELGIIVIKVICMMTIVTRLILV